MKKLISQNLLQSVDNRKIVAILELKFTICELNFREEVFILSELTYYLKSKRLRYDKTIQDMAKQLKICSKSYSLKENGKNDWTLSELVKLKKILKIDDSEMINIFFKQKSTKCE